MILPPLLYHYFKKGISQWQVPDEMTSADEDIIYYSQDEISADDIIRVPSSTVVVPDEESDN